MNQVLLVYKRSFLERQGDDPRILATLTSSERRRLLTADTEIRRSLHEIHTELLRRELNVDVVYRGVISLRKRYDLVVTVGGDGTFFIASHAVTRTPILGVNSDPDRSLGLHCGADRETFPQVLDEILSGRARVTLLHRLSLDVHGKRLPTPITNDVLFAHRVPASMARYLLRIDGGPEEEQRSSGIWIATASGSTGGIRAAGGKWMPLASSKIQYLVREPFTWPRRPKRINGMASRSIAIRCLVPEAAVWIDGPNRRIVLGLGESVLIKRGAPPLRVYGIDESRRRRLFP